MPGLYRCRSVLGAGLATLLLAGTVPVRAQEPPDPDDPLPLEAKRDSKGHSVTAEATVVGVASRARAIEPGSTVRVVTRDEIENSPARSLPELLQYLPGTDVRRRGPWGVQADIGLRGADYNGTVVLVDGEPMNDPQTNHFTADLDIPLDTVERVEILYGASSALYGSGAVGGVINIVTRGAVLGRARAQVEARWLVGSHSLDAGGVRVASRVTDAVSLAADWARTETNGFRDDTESASDAVRGSARWESGIGPVTLSGGYAARRFGAYAYYGTAFPWQQETTAVRTARLAGDLTLGGWTFSPSAAARAHHDDFVLDRDQPALYENLSDTTTTTARLVARHAAGAGALSLGVEGSREGIDSTGLGRHDRSLGAAYGEWAGAFRPSVPDAGGFRIGARVDSVEGFGTRFSPQASAWIAAGGGVRVRASAGTAFRVPTFTELYYRDPQNVGNPALAPEAALNVEAGTGFSRGALALDGAVFWRRSQDLIDFVRTSPSEPWVATNVREATTWGLEATARLTLPSRPGVAGLSSLAVQASYAFADLTALSTGLEGEAQGKYVLDPLHAKWDFLAWGTLPLGIAARTRVSYLARPSWADGVWLWDLRLGRDLLEGEILEVWVEGLNLGDVHYQESAGTPLPGRWMTAGLRLTW